MIDGKPKVLSAGKTRVLLACLLVRPNQVVFFPDLVDRIWGENPPVGARTALHMLMTRLRKSLGAAGELIQTRPGGYAIELGIDSLDLLRFERHLAAAAQARAIGDPAGEAAELVAAGQLWRGEPLVDVPSDVLQRAEVPRLVERHLLAAERRIDIDLKLGRHAEVVAELRELVAQHPLREQLWALLLIALYRSARQADALDAYQQVKALLSDELGLDPCPALVELQRKILTNDQSLATPAPPVLVRLKPAAVGQLPAEVADSVSRTDIVRQLTDGAQAGVVLLVGPPGVGKSALAAHTAHQLATNLADGQLRIDLRGYSDRAPIALNFCVIASQPRALQDCQCPYSWQRSLAIYNDAEIPESNEVIQLITQSGRQGQGN